MEKEIAKKAHAGDRPARIRTVSAPSTEQTLYLEFQSYASAQLSASYAVVDGLFKGIHKALTGRDSDLVPVKPTVVFGDKGSSPNLVAQYYPDYNSVIFYRRAFALFSEIKEESPGVAAYLNYVLDEAVAHELGHQLLTGLQQTMRNEALYSAKMLDWILYGYDSDRRARKMSEGMADLVGYYVAEKLNGRPTDNRNVARAMLVMQVASFVIMARAYEEHMKAFDSVSAKASKAELRELRKKCDASFDTMLNYDLPRLGIAKALLYTSMSTDIGMSTDIAEFAREMLTHPGGLNGVREYILDADGKIEAMKARYDKTNSMLRHLFNPKAEIDDLRSKFEMLAKWSAEAAAEAKAELNLLERLEAQGEQKS